MLALTSMTEPRTRIKARDIPGWSLALKVRRTQLGLSQEGVADASDDGISQKAVSDLETGRVQLTDMALGRVVALARALGWSLIEMQRATGVNLGVAEIETLPGQAAIPLYLLQDLIKANPQPDAYAFLAPNPNVKNPDTYLVTLMDSDEMATGERRSIPEGARVFFDPSIHVAEHENHTYVIEHAGRVHIRRFTKLPTGYAFTADNPAYAMAFIPADQARVLGKTYRIITDTAQSNRLTN